ncbi:hypothetical protein SCLCIDRAFT_1223308 [Scleroderma citrinum Foug A]|uniref:Uncharacterized protein n=1 Tax=Scleroderma citrinum Foug A TaxID=1036808 RepID=A0A0C2YTB1_9AGAM|nr:hypothetical protein SCLCIDRAFT_1223308 [Scleroderma citrinum Foug A]
MGPVLTDLQRMIMCDHLDAAAIRSKVEIEWPLKGRHNTNLASEMWVPSQKDVYDAISALSRLGIRAQHDDLHKLLPLNLMEAALGIWRNGLIKCVLFTHERFADTVPTTIDNEAI